MPIGFREGQSDTGEVKTPEIVRRDFSELPDDSGEAPYRAGLPDDSGETPHQEELPNNPGRGSFTREVNGKKYYNDDNGNLYRTGDDLKKDGTYELNGYQYKTDGLGRIVSVQGRLHMKMREGRLPIRDSLDVIGKGDQKENDDRGHLIGDQFDGPNGLENMIAQDPDINKNAFKNFENELAREVKAGKEVFVKYGVLYDGDSRRPSGIAVSYTIDREESVRIFPNDSKEG